MNPFVLVPSKMRIRLKKIEIHCLHNSRRVPGALKSDLCSIKNIVELVIMKNEKALFASDVTEITVLMLLRLLEGKIFEIHIN